MKQTNNTRLKWSGAWLAAFFLLGQLLIGGFAVAATTDKTRPTAPKNLVAKGIGATDADLAWGAATDNVSVTGYNVYRNGKRVAANLKVTKYTDSGLTVNRTYKYVVKALDAAGNLSKSSNLLTVKTVADDEPTEEIAPEPAPTPEPAPKPPVKPNPTPDSDPTPKPDPAPTPSKPAGPVTGSGYKTNPTFGKKVSKPPVIDGVNNGEWSDDNLIALGLANDDPRTLGKNWTLHETPMDMTHLWAAWDDTNLYLAWQYVDVTDVIDPANAGSSAGTPISAQNMLQSIAIDTTPGQGSANDMWGKNKGKPYWSKDLPDYQIYMASNFWQGFISKAVSGKFAVDDGGKNYFKLSAAGIEGKVKHGLAAKTLPGVMDADDRKDNSKIVDFLTKSHDTKRDVFYELKIPLKAIGDPDIEGKGIGVFLHQGEGSAMNSLPHDEAVLDTDGVEAWNSSLEWSDTDLFSVPFARIGK
jgi:hypothetical protein